MNKFFLAEGMFTLAILSTLDTQRNGIAIKIEGIGVDSNEVAFAYFKARYQNATDIVPLFFSVRCAAFSSMRLT